MIFKIRNPLSVTHNLGWSARFSVTAKMVVVTVLVGVIVWAAVDQIQGLRFENIFHTHLFEMLGQQATEDRMRFHQHVLAFHQSARIIATQEKFSDYVKGQQWSPEDKIRIRYHVHQPAAWLPSLSMLRTFARPRYALLLDSEGKVREVYMSREGDLPSALLAPTPILISQSQGQTYMTNIDGMSYFITSEPFISEDKREALLILASPIDDNFFNSLISAQRTGHVVALLTPGENPRVLASSSAEEMPAGTSLETLEKNYLVTSTEFFDYGSSDLLTKFASFISRKRAYELTRAAIASERKGRAVFAVVIILSFALLMFWLARRIQNITMRISDFSHTALGGKPSEIQKGDQLMILQERFHCLTEEVLEMRETINKQAEEKTRLIVSKAFDAIIAIDADGTITTWNPQAEVIFGWSREEAVGKKVADILIPAEYRKTHEERLKRFLETGDGQLLNRPIEITAIHRDRHEFPVEFTVAAARQNGTYIFIAIIRDITERKKAEEKLRASLREKEVLLKEIHHRVKNNMQIISSMLQLQHRQAGNGREAEILRESQYRVKSMALVHEKLYRSADMSHIDLKDYVSDLARGLLRSYMPVAGKVTVKLDVEDMQLAVDSAIPCGLIINELVTNSLKHAFPGGRSGEIKIALRKIPDISREGGFYNEVIPNLKTEDTTRQAEIELTVSDNGIGMPEDLDYKNAGSLGLRLVSVLSENQLRGTVELIRGAGTCFRVRFREEEYARSV